MDNDGNEVEKVNTQHLKYFVETIECGSIGKAAQKLLVNHSSIIYALNELEKSLNQQLLVREKNKILATEMGEQVYTDAKLILEIVDSWRLRDLALTKNMIMYNIDAIPSIFNSFLPDLVSSIKKLYPSFCIQSKEVASIIEVLQYKEKIPNIFFSSSFKKDSVIEQRLCESQNIEKIPLFKSKVAFFCNQNCLDDIEDSISIDDIKKIPLCTYIISAMDFNPLTPFLNLKNLYLVENQLETIEYIKTKNAGTLLPAFLKSFPNLVDLDKIRVCDILNINMYAYVSLYFFGDNRKSYINNRIINLIEKYPFESIEGIEKI